MLVGFFAARWLGPTVQGVWQTVRLFKAYSELVNLGQAFGMRREAAVAIGSGDAAELERQRDTGFVWNTTALLIAALGLSLYAALPQHPPLFRQALWTAVAAVALSGASIFFNLWHKANGHFSVLALVSVVSGITSLLGLALIPAMGFPGLILSYLLTQAVALVCLASAHRGGLRWRFSRPACVRSLRIGFPLFLQSVSALLFSNVDRILVVALLGFSDLGHYSISTICFLPVETAVAAVSVVLLPRLCQQFGAGASPGELRPLLLTPLSIFLPGLPSLTGLIALALPPLIRRLLPEYEAGILPAQIILIALSFSSASGFCQNVLVAAGRTWWLVGISGIGSVMKILLLWILIRRGYGLVGAAAASAAAYAVQFALYFCCSATLTQCRARVQIRGLAEAVIPALVCALLWWEIGDAGRLWPVLPWTWSLLGDYTRLLLLLVPALWSARRAIRLLRETGPGAGPADTMRPA